MSVGRHTLYNLAGSVAPMFVSIVTVPIYLHLVGPTRYGVLSIVWLFLGYFGLFEPGIGRAATYHIAKLHDASARERGDVFWTALVINTVFGLVGGFVLYLIARPLFETAFKMPGAMRSEVLACLPWLAMSVPISVASNVLASVLPAREWFGWSNSINFLNVVLTQAVPLLTAYFISADLLYLIPAILLARAVGTIPTYIAIFYALPLGAGGRFKRDLLPPLFSYGGWMTISNLVSPILMSADRMLVGDVLSADAVTFYTVPFNLVSRLSVIPGALSSSLFPKLSQRNQKDAHALASESVIGLAAIMTPLVACIIITLPLLMTLWVGPSLSSHCAQIGQVLLLGVWANGLAFIPYNLISASNRPDISAKIHLGETIPFLFVLWIGVHQFGIIGAAWAWTLRVASDAILMFLLAGQIRCLTTLVQGALALCWFVFAAPKPISGQSVLLDCFSILAVILWSWRIAPILRSLMHLYISRLSTMRV